MPGEGNGWARVFGPLELLGASSFSGAAEVPLSSGEEGDTSDGDAEIRLEVRRSSERWNGRAMIAPDGEVKYGFCE